MSHRPLCYNLEQLLDSSTLVKHSALSKSDFNLQAITAVIHAFAHWTWTVTGDRLLVTSAQGAWDSARDQYTLCEPAVHFPDDLLRFGDNNLGSRGVDNFFITHTCNHLCQGLALPRHPMQTQV